MQPAYIGMGANLASLAGPPEATLAAAAARLDSVGRVVARSSLYSTEPVGLTEQPRFTNAVLGLETRLEPRALLDALLDLESAFGRNRAEGIPKGPRTLDLDILLMGDVKLCEPGLEIPHPRLAERAFVLVPLHEIAPDAISPVHHQTVAHLLDALRAKHERDVHGVVRIESGLWYPSPRALSGDSSASSRTKTGQSHGHRD
jgi:2-amino-4-hydroxy-6-hydroxymethyldihydropteridine diphosphokinase